MITLDERKIFQGWPHTQTWPKTLWHECWRAICLR